MKGIGGKGKYLDLKCTVDEIKSRLSSHQHSQAPRSVMNREVIKHQ